MEELLVTFQVLILPPVLYESALTMVKKVKMFTRIGTVILTQIVSVLLGGAIFTALMYAMRIQLESSWALYIGFII